MTQDSTRQPPNPDLPVNVDGYETVEPFGDYRDEIARRVAMGLSVARPVSGESLIAWLYRRGKGRAS